MNYLPVSNRKEPHEFICIQKRIGDWACYIALFVALNQR